MLLSYCMIQFVKKLTLYILCMCALLFTLAGDVDAAYLYMEPTSGQHDVQEEFDVVVRIDTEGEKPLTSDVLLTFDSDVIQVIDVTEPPENDQIFTEVYDKGGTNRLYIGAAITVSGDAKSGDAPVAIITLRGTKDAVANVDIMCTPDSTVESNITIKKNKKTTDIINCDKVVGAQYTIGTGGSVLSPTPTPTLIPGTTITPTPTLIPGTTRVPSPTPSRTPTPSPTGGTGGTDITPTVTPTPTVASDSASLTATPTATPSELPETGIVETTRAIIIVGIVLTIASFVIKTFVL